MDMRNKLIVISQNMLRYHVGLLNEDAGGTVVALRVNLAWHKDISSAGELLRKYKDCKIFLDVPLGRKKPPNFEHDLDSIRTLVTLYGNIEYVAISNIENASKVNYYQGLFKAKIVPKIESFIGVKNARDIIKALNYEDKVVMLDHQDLYAELVRMNRADSYLELVDDLAKICKEEGACLLRTVGVVFAEWRTEE